MGQLSVQVLQEYDVTVTARLDPGLVPREARADVRRLGTWDPLAIDDSLLEEAWNVQDRYGFALWDAVALLAIAGLSIVGLPVDAMAQELDEPDESVDASTIADLAATIDPGSYVRVTWDRGRRDMGKLQLPAPVDSLSLRASAGTIEIPYAAIDSMWVGRTRTSDGAAIGGLAGAVAGGLVLLGLSEALCESPTGSCGGPSTSGWVAMIGGGAAVGAVVGALIGSGTLSWSIVFPRDGP